MSKEVGDNSFIKNNVVANDRFVILDSEDIGVGGNPAVKSTPIGSQGINVTWFGAKGDDSTNNTAYIQAAIDAAAINGGSVYMPAGIYRTGGLTNTYNVTIYGDGARSSTLKSITAETLITYPSVGSHPNNTIRDIGLEGNNIGTNGIYAESIALNTLERLFIRNFTGIGIHGNDYLDMQILNCVVNFCDVGVKLQGFASQALISGGQIGKNTTWGFEIVNGMMLGIKHCEVSNNGTAGNANTGAIYYYQDNDVGEFYGKIGMILDGVWNEAGKGTIIKLGTLYSDVRHSIKNSIFDKDGVAENSIDIDGNSSFEQLVMLENNHFGSGCVADGANAKIRSNQNLYATPFTLTNSATLLEAQYV